MDDELRKKLEVQEKKLDAVFRSVERTRRYFLWTLIISVVVIVLPLIGLAFIIPVYLGTLTGLSGL